MKFINNPWKLTHRQCEVIGAIIETDSNKAAAYKLGISQKTLEQHLWQSYKMMGVHTRVAAVIAYDRWARGAA